MSKALKAMQEARSLLLINHRFFGTLLMYLKLVEVDDPAFVDTMATDGINIYYHPPFVFELSEHEIVGVLAHEMFHCIYKHHLRLGNRDPRRWNIAADYVINLELVNMGFKLPKCALLDAQYANMSVEEVYNLLPNTTQEQNQSKSQGGSGAGNNKPNGNKSGQGKSQDENSGDGQNKSNDPGRMGGVISPASPSDKNTLEKETARWDVLTRQAVSIASKEAGKVPGFLERVVKELNKPKVPWPVVLRPYVENSTKKTDTWSKPNRKFIGSGIYLPGKVSDAVEHGVIVLDTSGSITDELLTSYLSEMTAFLDDGLFDKLTVICADAEVRNVQTFEAGDILDVKPKGGGGTNFRPTFEYIEKLDDVSLVIYFTDMLTLDFGKQPDCPVVWTVYGTETAFDRRTKSVPFGDAIHVGT